MIEPIVEIMESVFMFITDTVLSISGKFGLLILLAISLLAAFLFETQYNRTGWKGWVPVGIILFLSFAFAGGN